MKQIGIDARLYFQTGVGVYTRNFLHYLEKSDPKDMEFYVYVLAHESDQIHFQSPRFKKREVHAKWHTFEEQTSFYFALMRDNLDLMHFLYFSYPVLYKRPFIATVHDVTPVLFKTGRASTLPSFVYDIKHKVFVYVLGKQIQHARLIITPTHTVRKQLTEVFGPVISKKIRTLYEGINYEFLGATENDSLAATFKKPYLLYVGNFYPHKNVNRLLEAYEATKLDVDLILAGPDNYFTQKLKGTISKEQARSIHFFHPQSTADLVYLYKHAIALINPSLSEGFGLPMVEAAYFKTPIVASDLPVFHEILGDSYRSFNPTNTRDISSKLIDICRGRKPEPPRLDEQFDFSKMVKDYLEELQTIAY